MRRTLFLFAIIFIEGYVVLATELLAIRVTIPFIGSGTDTVSIIIAAVLMPLAFGYYKGGHFKPYIWAGRHIGVRRQLIWNIVVALGILTVGLSYRFLDLFFPALADMDIHNRLLMASIYAGIFIVTPVYLLGQTIPLISNYFTREKLSQVTGRILFVSTLGSFMGATFATLVLMSTVGVHNTVTLNFVLLAILVIMLSKGKISEMPVYAIGLALIGIIINSNAAMSQMGIVANNRYDTIAVEHNRTGGNELILNRVKSSMYNPDTGEKYAYILALEKILLDTPVEDDTPKDILVIGTGAFTFGLEDNVNHYDYVDIDPDLQKVAEENIIKQKLGETKTFIPVEARAYLRSTDKKYDVVLLDAYQGGYSIPEHLVTREFYQQVRDHMKDNGIIGTNFITAPSFTTPFSRHMDNTFRSVFPYTSRYVMYDDYALWTNDAQKQANVLYFSRLHPGDEKDNQIYTDDLNRVYLEKTKNFR